jgi:DNA-binding beta-propeller fold protein YncE
MMYRPSLLVVPFLAFTCSLSVAIAQGASPSSARLYFLSLADHGRVESVNPDGTDLEILSSGKADGPDGIVVDPQSKKVYWTNMGKVSLDDGSVQRIDLDGSNLTTIVPKGGAFTPKQLKLDAKHGKLYWSDREGMRIMRSNLDGSNVDTLVVTGEGNEARKDAANWCVGMALDVERGTVYWSQKGNGGDGRIFRANMEIPKGLWISHAASCIGPTVEIRRAAIP